MKQWTQRVLVPRDHPGLPGHFPGRPIAPGVVLLDLIFAAIQNATPQQLRIEKIVSAKFLKPVQPDEPVEVTIVLEDDDAASHELRARFRAVRGDEPVLEGRFVLGAAGAA